MKFSITTEDFSTKFTVYDAEGLDRYVVTNELDSVMRKLTMFDLADDVVCTVEKRFFALRPTYVVLNKQNEVVINIRKNLNLLHPEFTITSEDEESKDDEKIVAEVTRGGGYVIDVIDEETDAPTLIAIVISINLCCHHTIDE